VRLRSSGSLDLVLSHDALAAPARYAVERVPIGGRWHEPNDFINPTRAIWIEALGPNKLTDFEDVFHFGSFSVAVLVLPGFG
jgi:hypothetical protein